MAEVPSQQRTNRAPRNILASTPAALDLTVEALRVLVTAPLWWSRRAAEAGLSGQWASLSTAVAAVAPFDLCGLDVDPRPDLLDATPEAIGEAYVVALSADVRSRHGRHYTPPLLAKEMWQQTVSTAGGYPDGLVFDPAAGAGALLLPALRAWLLKHADTEPHLILRGVTSAIAGRDLDEAAVWLGNVVLAAELLPFWGRISGRHRRPLPALVSVGDGLASGIEAPAATVMNPPYGRIRLSPAERAHWSHAVSGHANLYALFTAAAVARSQPGGVVTALIPAGWLGGAYSRNLRAYLDSNAHLRRITYVTERTGVFSTRPLQETVVASFALGGPRRGVQVSRVTVNGHVTSECVGVAAAPRGETPWLLPRDRSDVPLIRAASMMRQRLDDYGWQVSTGPLVWNRHADQISATPADGALPIVWAADVDGGRMHQDPRRDAQRYITIEDSQRRLLVLNEPAVLLQRTTSPEQDRRLVGCALNRATLDAWGGEVVVENHVNVLTPPSSGTALTPRLLAALLAHPIVDRLYRCTTGSVAVSAYELGSLPLPALEVVKSWARLRGVALSREISRAYGVEL